MSKKTLVAGAGRQPTSSVGAPPGAGSPNPHRHMVNLPAVSMEDFMRESGSLSARLMSFEDPNLPQISQQPRGSGTSRPSKDAFANNEKIKVYSKKLAKIATTAAQSTAKISTPNPKKRAKNSTQNLVVTYSVGKGRAMSSGRVGGSVNPTSSAHAAAAAAAILSSSGTGSQILGQVRQVQKQPSNQTFEHIKNVIRSVERRKRKMTTASSSQTARQAPSTCYTRQVKDYSPASLSRSPGGHHAHGSHLLSGQSDRLTQLQEFYMHKEPSLSGNAGSAHSVTKRRSSKKDIDSL